MKILDIALKDLTRATRNRFAFGITIIAPLLLIGLIYFAFSDVFGKTLDGTTVNVGVVNAAQSHARRSFRRPLGEDIRSLLFNEKIYPWINPSDYADEASARASIDKGEIDLAVIIPQNFTKGILAGKQDGQIQIIHSPKQLAAPQAVQNTIADLLDGAIGSRIAIQTVFDRQQHTGQQADPDQLQELIDSYAKWYAGIQREKMQNPELAALVMAAPAVEIAPQDPVQNMLGPLMAGQMAFFAFFSGAFSMISILKEEEEGTLARLFTTNVGVSSILVGKLIAIILTITLQSAVLIAAAHYVFDINWGKPLAVLLALGGQVWVSVGLGVLLISFIRSARQGGPVMGGGLTLLGMLGGLFTSGFSMPEAFTKLAVLTPQGWVLRVWNVSLSGQPIGEMLIPISVMIVMGGAMFLIGLHLFQRRFG